MSAITVFISNFAVEVLCVQFVLLVSERKAVKAANCSLAIVVLMTLSFVRCYENSWNMIPMGLGAWLGTYFSVRPTKEVKNADSN